MAEIPRDPRQLARDILAGKVKIEDLARERQMRGGGAATPQMPAKIPLPRQVPSPLSPPPMQRGPVRPAQMPIPQRPMPQQRPVPQQRMPQRPMPQQPQRSAPPPPPPRQAMTRPVLTVTAPPVVAPQSTVTVVEAVTAPTRGEKRVRAMVASKGALRQGIIMAEILGKPVALRDEI